MDILPEAQCIVRHLAIPEQPEDSTPVVVYTEVERSSLIKFPGGLSLMALEERLAPLDEEAARAAKDTHILKEFLLPTNKHRKVNFVLLVWVKRGLT